MDKHPIRSEWNKYYEFLEALRKSGATNMWGATPYLTTMYDELTEDEATAILLSWINHYDELNKQFGWRD
jgi:hypothetical protein